MHLEEAKWIRNVLAKEPEVLSSGLVNFGSSTSFYRKVSQPFIDELIFQPLTGRGVKVIHTDIKDDEGVDLVGDLEDPRFFLSLSERKIGCALVANLLQHVSNPEALIKKIYDVVEDRGMIVITVPFRYPKHADPWDNMFRPSPEELVRLLPGAEVVDSLVLSIGTPFQTLKNKPGELLYLVLRCLIPFVKYRGWETAIHKLGWMFRQREVSCLAVIKSH